MGLFLFCLIAAATASSPEPQCSSAEANDLSYLGRVWTNLNDIVMRNVVDEWMPVLYGLNPEAKRECPQAQGWRSNLTCAEVGAGTLFEALWAYTWSDCLWEACPKRTTAALARAPGFRTIDCRVANLRYRCILRWVPYALASAVGLAVLLALAVLIACVSFCCCGE